MYGDDEKTVLEPHENARSKSYLTTELAIVKFRWFVVGFLFLYFNLLRLNNWPIPLFNSILLIVSAYNLGIHIILRKTQVFSAVLILTFLVCDMTGAAVAMYFTGKVSSPFLFLWFLTLFTGGIRFGYARSLILQVPMALCYAFFLFQDPGVLDPDFLSRLVLGVFSFSAVALFGSLFSREERFAFQVMAGFHQRAIIDGLTGLYNYSYFVDALKKEQARAERTGSHFSLIMFDLDFFKRVNDTYGHEKGNVLLRSIADILKANARRMDTVARYGGEEFVVLMPESNGSERDSAERIRKVIEETDFKGIGDGPTRITISGGICTYPRDARTAEELLDKADRGLYAAKTSGRNRICFCGERKE